jgi:hypothetical protein
VAIWRTSGTTSTTQALANAWANDRTMQVKRKPPISAVLIDNDGWLELAYRDKKEARLQLTQTELRWWWAGRSCKYPIGDASFCTKARIDSRRSETHTSTRATLRTDVRAADQATATR